MPASSGLFSRSSRAAEAHVDSISRYLARQNTNTALPVSLEPFVHLVAGCATGSRARQSRSETNKRPSE